MLGSPLYRSNSNLELAATTSSTSAAVKPRAYSSENHEISISSTSIRREYGSHGSIDVMGSASESFFAMLQELPPGCIDQRSPGPAEYLRSKLVEKRSSEIEACSNSRHSFMPQSTPLSNNPANVIPTSSTSPKLRLKLHRFWGGSDGNANASNSSGNNSGNANFSIKQKVDPDMEDFEENTRRRKGLAHFDVQSLVANLTNSGKFRGVLSRRRNTATGASAAAMLAARSSPSNEEEGQDLDEDHDAGDGTSNTLLESCPFFRNEIGGEQIRVVSLTQGIKAISLNSSAASGIQQSLQRLLHLPPLAIGLSILEPIQGESHWATEGVNCPYQHSKKTIERIDHGATYYRKFFHKQEHQNWFGLDENIGPVAISVRRERIPFSEINHDSSSTQIDPPVYHYRIVVRTSELTTLRGAVLEEVIPSSGGNKSHWSSNKSSIVPVSTKDLLEHIAPEIQLSCLRLGIPGSQTEHQLLKLDEQGLTNTYKVGVLYCRAGQNTEEQMYNNEQAGPALNEFLETLGQRVRLKGFKHYRAGLDNKTDSTGLYSVYAQYEDCELMFHVSTLLPFSSNNRQQLLRKRHIGNDIVTLVFQEPGAEPFSPKNIRSQFQHVFIVVRVINPCTENTCYSVAVTRSKDVPVFGPPIPEGATFPKSKSFTNFLHAKVINAENAAHRSAKFLSMATRTRQEYLKDLATNYVTTTQIDTSQPKFSMLSFSSRRKEKSTTGSSASGLSSLTGSSSVCNGSNSSSIGLLLGCSALGNLQRGALAWHVLLEDCSAGGFLVSCILGISIDTLVLVEESSRELALAVPCRSILGWATQQNSLRLFHHQGECVRMQLGRETDADSNGINELSEVCARLRAVTSGCAAHELCLRRNSLGQLGFHVQPDGIVTQAESHALHAGLRQGSRLVEICKVAVATLSHEQMVDLLKTSVLVTVTVIPPLSDGSPRRGCNLNGCRGSASSNLINLNNSSSGLDTRTGEVAYESISSNSTGKLNNSSNCSLNNANNGAALQQAGPHRRRYDRSFSPPRSITSSGYGSSNGNHPPPSNIEGGTLTSSSSGHSSDDRWYELLDGIELDSSPPPPPPLPARLDSGSISAFQQVSPKRPHQRGQAEITLTNQAAHNFALTSMTMLREKSLQSYLARNEDHSTDTSSASERITGIPSASEDELSAESGNVSPKVRSVRGGSIGSGFGGNSRNVSPKPGEARLRPGVSGSRNSSNRNSGNNGNLNTSSLQEELIRLINPDQIEESMNNNSLSLLSGSNKKNINNSTKKNFSIQVNAGSTCSPICGSDGNVSNTGSISKVEQKERCEVILTLARPATVISNASTASSPAPSENRGECRRPICKSQPEESREGTTTALPLPDAHRMDWPSLVDTATRAMLIPGVESNEISGSRRVVDLQNHLAREMRRRHTLEEEIRRLRDENRRLQDESQAAAQQLRRFTEWFFHTMERP